MTVYAVIFLPKIRQLVLVFILFSTSCQLFCIPDFQKKKIFIKKTKANFFLPSMHILKREKSENVCILLLLQLFHGSPKISVNFYRFQFMKPVYQNFVEKSMQQVAVQAAEFAVNNTTSVANGKLHQAWCVPAIVFSVTRPKNARARRTDNCQTIFCRMRELPSTKGIWQF